MTMAKEIMGGGTSAGAALAMGGTVNTALAASGTNQATATPVLNSLVIVTGANGTVGVILPAASPGDEILIFNNAASTLLVYPPTGAAISVAGTGLGSANTAFSQLTYKYSQYNCMSATQWLVMTTA